MFLVILIMCGSKLLHNNLCNPIYSLIVQWIHVQQTFVQWMNKWMLKKKSHWQICNFLFAIVSNLAIRIFRSSYYVHTGLELLELSE